MNINRHELLVRSSGHAELEIGRAGPGGLISGLLENTSYLLETNAAERRLYVDDQPLVQVSATRFAWAPDFFAGRVEVIAVDDDGSEAIYYLEVAPTSEKVGDDGFALMIDAIRQFDQRLLLGQSAACLGFGRAGTGGKFDELVRWERLKQHGRAFLKSAEAIVRMPHARLEPVSQALPLSQVRRLPTDALRDRRIVALVTGQPVAEGNVDSIQVHLRVPAATFDTPANRALCALLKRFRHTLVAMRNCVEKDRDGLSAAEAFGKRTRRLEILHRYDDEARRLLACYPFRSVTKSETTAAGLTQIAANPAYARAYRKGTDALRLGVERETSEHLRVSPSWGVYETWCFVALAEALESTLGVDFRPHASRFANSDLTLVASLADGRCLELLFQATFRSDGLDSNHGAWSLSRERRPDIVLVVSKGHERRMLVLDAKYRSGKANVLDAMASAHIYHDSLFLGGRRPDTCLLLLPGSPEVASLEDPMTWEAFGVGTLSRYSVEADGIPRCAEAVSAWLHECKMDGLPTGLISRQAEQT